MMKILLCIVIYINNVFFISFQKMSIPSSNGYWSGRSHCAPPITNKYLWLRAPETRILRSDLVMTTTRASLVCLEDMNPEIQNYRGIFGPQAMRSIFEAA